MMKSMTNIYVQEDMNSIIRRRIEMDTENINPILRNVKSVRCWTNARIQRIIKK